MLRHVLAAKPSQALDIEHRDHPIGYLDQPGFLQCVQGPIDTLPRCTDEMTKLFVGDFDTSFPVWIEFWMQHVRDGVGDARFRLVQAVVLERADELPEAFVEPGSWRGAASQIQQGNDNHDTTSDTRARCRCKIEKSSVAGHLRWRVQFATEPARCFPGFHRID